MGKAGVAAVLLAVAVFAAGCGGEKGDKGEKAGDKKDSPAVIDDTKQRTVKIDIDGARAVHVETRIDVRVLATQGLKDQPQSSVGTITLPTPLRLTNGDLLMPDVAVFDGYHGDGTYTIPAGVGQAPTTGETLPAPAVSGPPPGHAVVAFVTPQPPAEARFAYLLKPCTLVVAENGARGSADCPSLVAADGAKVSFKMSWKP